MSFSNCLAFKITRPQSSWFLILGLFKKCCVEWLDSKFSWIKGTYYATHSQGDALQILVWCITWCCYWFQLMAEKGELHIEHISSKRWLAVVFIIALHAVFGLKIVQNRFFLINVIRPLTWWVGFYLAEL